MAWWSGKVSLTGLQDIAGAVNKISESVKNIEKNFDSALGLEEKRDDEEGTHCNASDAETLLPSPFLWVPGLHWCTYMLGCAQVLI